MLSCLNLCTSIKTFWLFFLKATLSFALISSGQNELSHIVLHLKWGGSSGLHLLCCFQIYPEHYAYTHSPVFEKVKTDCMFISPHLCTSSSRWGTSMFLWATQGLEWLTSLYRFIFVVNITPEFPQWWAPLGTGNMHRKIPFLQNMHLVWSIPCTERQGNTRDPAERSQGSAREGTGRGTNSPLRHDRNSVI